MKYIFMYNTLVNRDYNIYKEIIINPFVFSFLGVYNPMDIKNIVDYTKEKDVNILKNIIPGQNLNTAILASIYQILSDYKFFEDESFNIFSKYLIDLLSSSKVEEVYIIIDDVSDKINKQEVTNIKRVFKEHPKLKIIESGTSSLSDILKNIEWNCIFLRDVEQSIEIITSGVSVKDRDLVLDELLFNKLDPLNYLLLQEKEGRIDYRAMI